MTAATEAFHAALSTACGFGVRDEADRVISFVESLRDEMIAGGADARVALASAYQTAARLCSCGAHAWKLVNQHFGLNGRQPEQPTQTDVAAHLGRVFGFAP